MYARRVSVSLKANSRTDFTKKLENEIVPILRKQKGFKDAIVFVAPSGKEAFAMSMWDSKESADAYNRQSFAEVTKSLSKLIDGSPRVETYEVVSSTFHKIAATPKAA